MTVAPTTRPRLILCADGGGSKVCVVVRSEDGLEVRGTAGPCNV
jgi:N-acetylglucosamine kinase-like BadF-type ATPase